MKLDIYQQRFVKNDSYPCVLLAGPGSGKTTVIIEKIKRVREPVYYLVYNVAAKYDASERFKKLRVKARIDTFHGFLYGILSSKYPSTTFIMIEESKKTRGQHWRDWAPERFDLSSNKIVTLSFVDLERWVYTHFEQVVKDIPKGIIIVDEMQDLNYAQLAILYKFHKAGFKLCLVGDLLQSIYTFRGVDPEQIVDFLGQIKAKQLFLRYNYRSCKSIVLKLNEIFEEDFKAGRDCDGRILGFRFKTPRQEASFFAKFILEKVVSTPDVSSYFGPLAEEFPSKISLSDIGILVRSRAQLKVVKEELARRGVPYLVVGEVPEKLKQLEDKLREMILRREQKIDVGNLVDTSEFPFDVLAAFLRDVSRQDTLYVYNKVVEFVKLLRSGYFYRKSSYVLLSTIHSSKGLEFGTVFLLGLRKGIFPANYESAQAERRLLYVGFSRAKDLVVLSYSGAPSVFVDYFKDTEFVDVFSKIRRRKSSQLRLV